MKIRRLLPVIALLPLMTAPMAQAADGEALFKSKPCVACHTVDKKVVGPALKDVSKKYAGDADAPARLADHIKNGTKGHWGPVPMPPNPVTEDEAMTLAKWILTL